MNSKIKFWRKRAKKIAQLEGVGESLTFHPTDKETYLASGFTQVTGTFNPYTREVKFCIRKYQGRTAMANLLHELAHAIDFQKRRWIPRGLWHDKIFQREWTRLKRKYLWK